MKKREHSTMNIQRPTFREDGVGALEIREGGQPGRKFDLEERLLEFASAVIDLSEMLPNTRAGNH